MVVANSARDAGARKPVAVDRDAKAALMSAEALGRGSEGGAMNWLRPEV
jgi:hypothetical protein